MVAGLNVRLPGVIVSLEGNIKRVNALENIFVARRGGIAIRRLRTALFTMLPSLEKLPIPDCPLYWADGISKIVREKVTVTMITRRFFEKLAKEGGVHEGDLEVALRILRGLGLLEVFRLGNLRFAGLTRLGSIVRDFVGDEGVPEHVRLHALVISSFPFSTKMRVVYGLYYMHGVSPSGFYATLRDKLFAYDWERKLRYYESVERPALEVMEEIVLTRAGSSRRYVSETQLLTKLLEGYLKVFNGSKEGLNELFRAVNKQLRYKHAERFAYESAAWEALRPGAYSELKDILRSYGLAQLQQLVDSLDREFTAIEYQLHCLNGLPVKF
jgi:hypothetical protein